MRTCVQLWGRGGLHFRSGILLFLVPPFILALQLLVVGTRLPRATRSGVEGQEGEVAFSVISIEPERNSRQRGSPSRRPGLKEEEEGVDLEDGPGKEGARAYEDENEIHSRQVGRITTKVYIYVENFLECLHCCLVTDI